MPFVHSQSDGTTASADERGLKNNPATCHIDFSVSDEETKDNRNFSSITHIINYSFMTKTSVLKTNSLCTIYCNFKNGPVTR